MCHVLICSRVVCLQGNRFAHMERKPYAMKKRFSPYRIHIERERSKQTFNK